MLRFEIADYVSDPFDFFERKQLIGADEDLMFRAATEILVPPESVRDQLSPPHWRRLFAGIVAIISERTGRSYPVLTRQFYDRISRRETINGVSSKQVMESLQEALDAIPTDSQTDERSSATPSTENFDPKRLLTQSFAACGAGSYDALRTLLLRRHALEFGSALFALSVVGVVAVVFAPMVTPVIASALATPLITEGLLIATVVVLYLISVGLSYQEIDEVLHEAYGTSLRELESALLPSKRRRSRDR